MSHVKLMRKPGTHIPTDDEDIAIMAAIDSDPDTRDFSQEENIQLMTFDQWRKSRGLEWDGKIRKGRPQVAGNKEKVTVRYSPHVVNAFRATGKGWQTRLNIALDDWLKEHDPDDIKL